MTPNEEIRTLLTAKQHAGGFLYRIAEAALHADPVNRQRVFAAFPELISVYGPDAPLYQEV